LAAVEDALDLHGALHRLADDRQRPEREHRGELDADPHPLGRIADVSRREQEEGDPVDVLRVRPLASRRGVVPREVARRGAVFPPGPCSIRGRGRPPFGGVPEGCLRARREARRSLPVASTRRGTARPRPSSARARPGYGGRRPGLLSQNLVDVIPGHEQGDAQRLPLGSCVPDHPRLCASASLVFSESFIPMSARTPRCAATYSPAARPGPSSTTAARSCRRRRPGPHPARRRSGPVTPRGGGRGWPLPSAGRSPCARSPGTRQPCCARPSRSSAASFPAASAFFITPQRFQISIATRR
jgi:hypothetical protein